MANLVELKQKEIEHGHQDQPQHMNSYGEFFCSELNFDGCTFNSDQLVELIHYCGHVLNLKNVQPSQLGV